MLKINNLHASIEDKQILKGINLQIKPGEVHAIMGPNGSGKSTLSKAIAGHPKCIVNKGEINYNNKSILNMTPDERALKGIFLSFQYPVEVPGVNNASFLRMTYNAKQRAAGKDELDPFDFMDLAKEKLKLLEMDSDFLNRSLNQGFSGGEKKRNEILQMAVLEPSLAILDELDSGLDIDALRIVSNVVNKLKNKDTGILMITHYQRLLDYIVPDYIHVLSDGKIIKSGDKSFALELEEKGYDWL